MKAAIIGAGAAGFFAAISLANHHPEAEVFIFEKSNKTLAKLRISGGGRCNVMHRVLPVASLVKNYPRGASFLKKAFSQFGPEQSRHWFESRGVTLITEADGRMFPSTNSSETIARLLEAEAHRLGVKVVLGAAISGIKPARDGAEIEVNGDSIMFHRVVLATGGLTATVRGWCSTLGVKTTATVPSLFTFNLAHHGITALTGVSVPEAEVRVAGNATRSRGPLLITHWGLSGPAVLKMSALAATSAAEANYKFAFWVNWVPTVAQVDVRLALDDGGNALARNHCPWHLPKRLWHYLLLQSGANPDRPLAEQRKDIKNRLTELLTNEPFQTAGKTTYKEEFVTAGGVDLSEISPLSMTHAQHPWLRVAGELLDVDGYTGGFNFQAAWTTGYLSGV